MNEKTKDKLIKNQFGNIKQTDTNISIWLEEYTSKILYNKNTNTIFNDGIPVENADEFKKSIKIKCEDELGIEVKKKSFDDRWYLYLNDNLCDTIVDDFSQEGISLDELNEKEKENNKYNWLINFPDIITDKDGNFKKLKIDSPNNYIYFFENYKKHKYEFKYDTYNNINMIDGERSNDYILSTLRVLIYTECHIINKNLFRDAYHYLLWKNRYNSAQEYFKQLKWDGKKRLDTVFIDAFNVKDTPMHREMIRKWFLSGIVRIFNPGYPVEGMIILTGISDNKDENDVRKGHGIGKSYLIEKLAGKLRMGNLTPSTFRDNNKIIELCKSNFIIHDDELKALHNVGIETYKSFITQSYDSGIRLAYKEEDADFYRHCIYIGSTNEATFINDATNSSERRFWILKCNTSGTERCEKYLGGKEKENETVDQIWAEAYHEYYNIIKNKNDKNINFDLTLSSKYVDEFTEEQNDFNCDNEDEKIEMFVNILEKKFETPKDSEFFNTKNDFFEQCNRGFIENDFKYHQINIIPHAWIKEYCKMSRGYSAQRLSKYVIGKWVCKNARYPKDQMKCWCRIKPVEIGNNNNEMSELFEKVDSLSN